MFYRHTHIGISTSDYLDIINKALVSKLVRLLCVCVVVILPPERSLTCTIGMLYEIIFQKLIIIIIFYSKKGRER